MPASSSKKVSALFRVVTNTGNSLLITRHAAVHVEIYGQGDACEGCQALRAAFVEFACVLSVEFVAPEEGKKCHSRAVLYDPQSSKPLKVVSGIATKSQTHMVTKLNKLLRIKRPFKPLPHQRKLIARHHAKLPKGLLIAFALGSGKTHSSLGLLDAAGEFNVKVVAAVSLLAQWKDTIMLHAPPLGLKTPVTRYRLLGYQKFEAVVYTKPNYLAGSSVILDEAHHYKNMTAAMLPAVEGLQRADHLLALTGTPARNDVRDLDLILRLLGMDELIPDESKDDDATTSNRSRHWSEYIGKEPPNPYGTPEMRDKILRALIGRVAQYNPKYCESERKYTSRYPQTAEEEIKHTLTWQQAVELAFYGQGVTVKVNGKNLSIGASGGVLRRLSILNASYDDCTDCLYSSKADRLVEKVAEVGGYPQVAYSRFRANMLEPLATRLRERFGVRVETLTGETQVPKREVILNDYNRGKVQILLICRVGGEGLDLTAPTKAVHLLEPQNNRAEEEQVIGRVVRYSKSKLADDRQPVRIYRYACCYPTDKPTKEEREYMLDLLRADTRIVRAFGGKLRFKDVLKHTRGIFQADNYQTEEQHMAEANRVKHARTFPLNVVLWMASGEDAKGKGVPKYWRDEYLKLQDPEKARRLEKARRKRKVRASSKKTQPLTKKAKLKKQKKQARALVSAPGPVPTPAQGSPQRPQ